jgi:hypothetical protein
LAGISMSILAAFKILLGLAFSLFSILPGVNPMIPSELFITDLVGVMFWFGFKAARGDGKFRIAGESAKDIWKLTHELFAYQAGILGKGLSPQNLKSTARRLRSWLSGEIPVDAANARGEIMATACMAWLIAGHNDGFSGPMGQIFIQAIRDRFPDLAHASIEQIAEHMRLYDAGQLEGVISEIKGRMFELLEIDAFNHRDGIRAVSESDMSHPGDDIVLQDEKTGHVLLIQLKATDTPSYIEHALHNYPAVPILTTEEVSHHFSNDGRVWGSGLKNAKLEAVTHENFDRLMHGLEPVSAIHTAAGGVAARAIVRLWPFVVAYLRKRITQAQLEEAFKKVLGDSGVSLAARVSYSLAFDAVFAWYLLARGVIKIVQAGQRAAQSEPALARGAQSTPPAGAAF